jgi:uncharacterized protein YbjT (DUF2867 family)/uncharacterized membrane protein YphA (DoxX/SURF4 family)
MQSMRVLVTGAQGFIGREVVAALHRAGHRPVSAVRAARFRELPAGTVAVSCDFATDVDPAVWTPRLAGIDAVVNCAGILRERGTDRHARVHEEVPAALFRACAESGVRRVVQISALGDPADSEFIASKHRGDAALMALDLDWVVLRPSVVVSTRGSYGGSSLLRALAALPVVPLPGRGEQRLQPILIDDLCAAMLAALDRDAAARQCIELGGPEPMTLREYLVLWRDWLGLGPARFVAVPKPLARLGALLGERFGRGPLGMIMWRMLERGKVLSPGAHEHSRQRLGFAPQSLANSLAQVPAHSADRWHARLHLLAPVLRVVLALTWLASGVVGLLIADADVLALMQPTGWPAWMVLALAWGGSLADLALGALLLIGWRPRWVLGLMAVMVVGYTICIGLWLPQAWLDPFGGLLKNPALLTAIGIAAATAERD